jgi:hypothetical protein
VVPALLWHPGSNVSAASARANGPAVNIVFMVETPSLGWRLQVVRI